MFEVVPGPPVKVEPGGKGPVVETPGAVEGPIDGAMDGIPPAAPILGSAEICAVEVTDGFLPNRPSPVNFLLRRLWRNSSSVSCLRNSSILICSLRSRRFLKSNMPLAAPRKPSPNSPSLMPRLGLYLLGLPLI